MSKISAYTAKTSGALTDEFVINDVAGGSVNKKVLLSDFGVQGTFTATLTAATPPTTPPTTTANYTIIGNRVYLDIQFSSVDTSGASGTLQITGLPAAITPVTRQYGTAHSVNVAASTLGQISSVSGVVIELYETDSTSRLAIIAGTTKTLNINIEYRI